MPLYDTYEQYRQPLTQEDLEKGIKPAEGELKKMLAGIEKGELHWAEDGKGFINPQEPDVYLPNPVTAEHMGIAINRAEEQFKGWPAMPEDIETGLRYPGIDPVGNYSVIDMDFAYRMARIEAVLQTRSPEVQAYVRELMDVKNNNADVKRLGDTLSFTAQRHRVITRASKLCLDPHGRELLHQQACTMENDLGVTLYDQYVQGIEYAAGVKTGPVPQGVEDFYRERVAPLNMDLIQKAAQFYQEPREISVEFQNLDHKLLQSQFANPHNWGKKPKEVTAVGLNVEEAMGVIPAYARATAKRVLDPLYKSVERVDLEESTENTSKRNLSRADMIIIDGKTVREKMFEDFAAANPKDENIENEFQAFYKTNHAQAANEYVAAALMAGKRVEAFVPDKNGKIPWEPTQITKTGYEPSPLRKVTLNAWERFWSKHGFYKEKTAKAAEYQRMTEARERVRETNYLARLSRSANIADPETKAPYLRDWVREHGPELDGGPYRFSVDRSAMSSIAVCGLINRGYSMEDIFAPDKLLNEKAAMGREVLQRMKDGDGNWLGKQMFHGQRCIADYIDWKATQVNLTNPQELYQESNKILFFAGSVLFDTEQEKDRVKEGYWGAAERAAPGMGERMAEEVIDRANSLCVYFDLAKKSLGASVTMAGGMGTGVQAYVRFIGGFETMRQTMAANPNQPLSRRVDQMTALAFQAAGDTLAATSRTYQQMVNKADSNVEAQKAFGRDMLSGQMQSRMKITADINTLQLDFQLAEPTKEAAKQAEDSRQLQETARQNQMKAAKPMGGGGRHM